MSRWLSDLRFEPFLAEGGGDQQRAIDLYIWDGALAGACLETVRHVEVLLRNSIHDTVRETRPPNALQSWLLDAALLDAKEIQRVEEASARIKQDKRAPTEDRVVAALPFGFWTRLLGTRYEELWRHTLHCAFPNGDGTRHQIAGFANRVAQFRNRLAHHEPIFNRAVLDRCEDALALAGAIDVGARIWIEAQSRVPEILAARP